jgi:CheY-like chemotaxis protein
MRSAFLKVLIVEDDLMIADLIECMLEGHYVICGTARTIIEAVEIARLHRPDLALVDYRLADGDLGTDAARALLAIGQVGILYASASVTEVIDAATKGTACLSKPYSGSDLLKSLEIVAEVSSGGAPPRLFPRGLTFMHQATAA